MSICKNLSQALQDIRHLRQRSINEFAEDMGLARSTMQDLLSGQANPRVGTVEQIAARLEVDPLTLLGYTQEAAPSPLCILLGQVDRLSRLSTEEREELLLLLEKISRLTGDTL